MINFNDDVDKSFHEVLYGTDNWINKGFGWIIEAEYVNISVYSPLSGSTYIELPCELKKSIKVLINIKSDGNKCFPSCHIKYLNPLKTHPERITKAGKKVVNDLDYKVLNLLKKYW